MVKYVTEERFELAMQEINRQFAEMNNKLDKVFNILDGMSGVMLRLDQERVFTNEWIHRIESDVNRIKDSSRSHNYFECLSAGRRGSWLLER